MEERKEGLSRRKFLAGAGVLAAGAAVAGSAFVGGGLAMSEEAVKVVVNGKEITGPVPARVVKGTALAPVRPLAEALGARVAWDGAARAVVVSAAASAAPVAQAQPAQSPSVPEWPWPYKKLDPEVVRKRGYEFYFQGGCMYGAAAALLTTLREEVGYPYTLIPIDMFRYGAGGAVSWGTLCGALNGCGAVMNLITKDYAKILNELIGWYTEFPFPSNKHEAYCKFKNQVTTVAKSPLCHVSVTKWANAAGAKINSDAKKDRCAKLTGDTAAKAVELMNALVDGKFVAAFKPAQEYAHCLTCHEGTASALDNEQGKMNCVQCHTDHTKK